MTKSLKIATWNANGVSQKFLEISNFLNYNQIDILTINETKLKNNHKFFIKGYQTYRQDRQDNSGFGGIAILVKNIIASTILPTINCTIENASVQIDGNLIITAVYNSPSRKFSTNCLRFLFSRKNKVIVLGDLNAKHEEWNCNCRNTNGNRLFSFLEANDDVILNIPNGHTHFPDNGKAPSTIDLILTKNINLNSIPDASCQLGSDHNPVIFSVNYSSERNPTKLVYDYSNADWAKFRTILDSKITINNKIETASDIEREIEKFTKALKYARDKTISKKPRAEVAEKLPAHIIDLIKFRNKIRKRWQSHQRQVDKTLLNSYTREIRNHIKIFQNERWEQKISRLNSNNKDLWKTVKSSIQKFSQVPILVQNSANYITDKEKADVLAENFETAHHISQTDSPEQADIRKRVEDFINSNRFVKPENHLLTNPSEIRDEIKKLPLNKAPGKDEVDNRLIRNLSRKAIVQLNYIINAVFKFQHWPSCWKTAVVTPIPKAGKVTTSPGNYRPISLLSNLSKLTEKILLGKIKQVMKNNKIRDDHQFGFKEKHSSTQQICRIVVDVINSFNNKNHTVMLLLDIEKAFDKVWIEGLTYKLIKLKFPKFLIKTIYSYLNNRKFIVRVGNETSAPKNIKAGIVQGSVLGPRLFNIYVQDIPKHNKTKIALFADDTAIYAHSSSAEDANRELKNHLEVLINYFDRWKIKLNETKAEQIVFSRRRNEKVILDKLKINNTEIVPKSSVKYLGIELDERLNFHRHIKAQIHKGYAIKKILHPLLCSKSMLNEKNKLLIYKTYIRPVVTYAAPAFCHLRPFPIRPIQNLQNKILRLALSKPYYTRISKLHELADIPTIREYLNKVSSDFYEFQCKSNALTRQITKTRLHASPHPLPYQFLPIFLKPP